MKSCHCDTLEGPRGYYAKEISQRKPNTVWSHFNAELKKQNKLIIKKNKKQKNRPIDIENKPMVAKGGWVAGAGAGE